MSGRSSQNKGKAGEREVADIIFYATGVKATRNLNQARNGGHDLDGVPGISVEVKRQEKLSINTWWKQCTRQATEAGLVPVLAYRQNRKPWSFVVSVDRIPMSQPVFLRWLKNHLQKQANLP